MENYSALAEERKEYFVGRVNHRWAQLHAIEKEWGDRAYKFLLLTNAGGAIATLSFLGAKPDDLLIFYAKLALGMFMTGVVFTGIATAQRLHRAGRLLNRYRADAEKFFSDQLSWVDLYKIDEKRALTFNLWNYLLPYSSFFAFIVGIAAGGVALFGSGLTTTPITVVETANEISLPQLVAACVGVLASVFFGIGVVKQTPEAMASQSRTVINANMQVLCALAEQKAHYVVGTSLLFGAFSLQIFALVCQRLGILTGHEVLYAAIAGMVLTSIGFGLGMLIVRPLAAHYLRQAKEALHARIAANSMGTTPPAVIPEAAPTTESRVG